MIKIFAREVNQRTGLMESWEHYEERINDFLAENDCDITIPNWDEVIVLQVRDDEIVFTPDMDVTEDTDA